MRTLAPLVVLLLGVGTAAVTHAQITPWPVVLTMTGPSTAVSGQEVTYRVHYRLTDPAVISQTSFQIDIPRNTAYVSSQVVLGPAGLLTRVEETFVEWGGLGNAEETEGAVEMTVRIDPDFVGSIGTQADERGTETAHSNIVETQVFARSMLPETGGGGGAAGPVPLVAPALIALVGAALVCAGAAGRYGRGAR